MQINDHDDVVEWVLKLQQQATELGLTLVFETRHRPHCPVALAAVISGLGEKEHVFFSFTEASAFMHGLAVAQRQIRKE